MTTSTAYSVRALLLAGLMVGAVGMPTPAADDMSNLWSSTSAPCSSCGNGACSGCFGGLDDYSCGDMTPLALCPGGRWYFQANLIAFRRDACQEEVFQTRNVNTLTSQEVLDNDGNSLGPPRVWNLLSTITRENVLGTEDLDFQNAVGYRLLLGWKLAEKYAVEFSYFDLNDWDETGAVSDATPYDIANPADIDPASGVITVSATYPNSLFSPFTDFGNPVYPVAMLEDFDYNNLASIQYQSSLDNVELNVRHWITTKPSRINVAVLWGGRHNAVREWFHYYSTSPVPAANTENNVYLRTQNDLWGFQIGSQIDFCWDPGWHTEFEVKGGVAQNRAVMEGAYAIQDGAAGGGLVNYNDRVDKDVTSWIGEMRLTLVYQFGAHLTTHVGYEALVLSKLALASRNFETDLSILENGPWVMNNGGSVVYHGPSAGFTFAW